MLWVLICTVHLTVCYHHVTYEVQSESTLYSFSWMSRNSYHIWSLSDCKEIQTHSHLVRKRTSPVWRNGWVFVYEQSGCGFESRCSHLNFRYGASFKQRVPWHSGKSVECKLTLNLVHDMIITYSHFQCWFKFLGKNARSVQKVTSVKKLPITNGESFLELIFVLT